MEFRGTKGKWEITKECSNGIVEEELAINIKSNEDLMFDICAVWDDLHTREEAKANALLISKAPEMLEMLKSFVDNNMLSVVGEEMAVKLIKQATYL